MRTTFAAVAGRALIGLGFLALVAATGWWWRTFADVVNYGYLSWGEAGRCLIDNGDICSLAKALCIGSHPRNFPSYWSTIFWAGFGLFSLGCLREASRPFTTPARTNST